MLLAGQVLFFNHRAAPTLSAAIIQLHQSCCWTGRSEELVNMQHSSEGWQVNSSIGTCHMTPSELQFNNTSLLRASRTELLRESFGTSGEKSQADVQVRRTSEL